jgi:hypothetical protein
LLWHFLLFARLVLLLDILSDVNELVLDVRIVHRAQIYYVILYLFATFLRTFLKQLGA